MMRISNQGYIGNDDDKNYYIYGESKLNHYHVEFFTYHLWCKKIKALSEKYFLDGNYYWSKVLRPLPYIGLNLSNNNEIRIWFEGQRFEVGFLKNNGECCKSDFSSNLKEILIRNNFEWRNEDDFYYYGHFYFSENATYKAVSDLLEALK